MTTALLVTSNGAGMGHLSRQLSVALAGEAEMRSVLFSLSLGLPQVLGFGIPGEYCPSYERDWMPRRFWNRYLRTRLVALCQEVGADVVLFDGVAPYLGLLGARRQLPDTAFVWMRRGMWLAGTGARSLRMSSQFDAVLTPGDLGSGDDTGPTAGLGDSVSIPPVSMLEVVPRLDRTDAATALGLDPHRPTLLVTLGSGRLGDAATPAGVALEALLEEPAWQVAMTTPAIARSGIPVPDRTGVVELEGIYPLARYLRAFDAVVSASGYNAVHEFVSGGIPTLLVPNQATRTDDQAARARGVAARGLALAAHDPHQIRTGVRSLLDASVRHDLVSAIDALELPDRYGGAAAAARQLVRTATGHRATLSARLRAGRSAADDAVRSAAMTALGPTGTAMVRKLLRRTEPGGRAEPLEVSIGEASDTAVPLLFSDTANIADIRSGRPIEHLLGGTSDAYRQERMAIIRRNYRVVDPG